MMSDLAKLVARCTPEEFTSLVKDLRAVAGFPRGCSVRFCQHPAEDMESLGDVEKTGRVFRVRIADNISYHHTAELLIHESAHILTWRPYTPLSEDHGAVWGVEYAALYQRFHHVR